MAHTPESLNAQTIAQLVQLITEEDRQSLKKARKSEIVSHILSKQDPGAPSGTPDSSQASSGTPDSSQAGTPAAPPDFVKAMAMMTSALTTLAETQKTTLTQLASAAKPQTADATASKTKTASGRDWTSTELWTPILADIKGISQTERRIKRVESAQSKKESKVGIAAAFSQATELDAGFVFAALAAVAGNLQVIADSSLKLGDDDYSLPQVHETTIRATDGAAMPKQIFHDMPSLIDYALVEHLRATGIQRFMDLIHHIHEEMQREGITTPLLRVVDGDLREVAPVYEAIRQAKAAIQRSASTAKPKDLFAILATATPFPRHPEQYLDPRSYTVPLAILTLAAESNPTEYEAVLDDWKEGARKIFVEWDKEKRLGSANMANVKRWRLTQQPKAQVPKWKDRDLLASLRAPQPPRGDSASPPRKKSKKPEAAAVDRDRNCIKCGKKFTAAMPNFTRCDDCQAKWRAAAGITKRTSG